MPTTGWVEQLEDGPRRHCSRDLRDSQESAVGLMPVEQLADMGQSDPAASRLNNHATFLKLERADASVRLTRLGSTHLLQSLGHRCHR